MHTWGDRHKHQLQVPKGQESTNVQSPTTTNIVHRASLVSLSLSEEPRDTFFSASFGTPNGWLRDKSNGKMIRVLNRV